MLKTRLLKWRRFQCPTANFWINGELVVAEVTELVALQRLDNDINSKRRRLAEIEAELKDDLELRKSRAALARTESQFRDLESTQKSSEWDVEQTTDRISQVERRLMGNQVTNPRELETLQREIRNLQERQSQLEDLALDAMEKVEKARPVVEARQATAESLEERWSTNQSHISKEREAIVAELPSLQEGRSIAEAAVPALLRQTYQRIASKKGGIGISRLQGATCSECRVSLPSQQVQKARSGDGIVTCNNCGRIIYA